MATEGELDTLLQDVTRLVYNLWTNQTVLADQDTLEGDLAGPLVGAFADAADAFRQDVQSALSAERIQSLLEPWVESYLQDVVGEPVVGFTAGFRRVREYWRDNSKTVLERTLSFGTSSGSTTGTGQISRLTVDENGDNIESDQPTTKTWEIDQDQSQGATKHEERFVVFDEERLQGGNLVTSKFATGEKITTRNRSSRNSLISNPSFKQISGLSDSDFSAGTASLTSSMTLTDWTFDTGQIQDHEVDRNDVFEDPEGTNNPHSLVLKAAAKISQALSVANVEVSERRPTHFSLAVKPDGSADGNLVLKLGSAQLTQAVSGLSANSWQIIEIPLDKNRWPSQWNEGDPDVEIEWTGTAGQVKIQKALVAEMEEFPTGGSYWMPQGGETKWILGDTKTFADSISGSDSKIQFILSLIQEMLPHASSPSETVADP